MCVPPLIFAKRAARREMDSGQGRRLGALHGFSEEATYWRIDTESPKAVPIDLAARWFAEDRPHRVFLGDYAGAVEAGKGIR